MTMVSKGKDGGVCVMDSSKMAVGFPISTREEALYAWAEGVMKRGKTQQQPSLLRSSINGMRASELWTVAEAVLSSSVAASSVNDCMNGTTTVLTAGEMTNGDIVVNNPMGGNKTCKAVEALIELAVSNQCANRHDFVSVILETPNDIVRAELKAVIEESTALVPSISDSSEGVARSSNQGAATIRTSCDDDELSSKLLSALERERFLTKEVERLRRTCEDSIVRVELDKIEAEDKFHVGLDAELDELRKELRKVRRRNEQLEPLAEEAVALRDEIDCLRPLSANLAKAEAALSKCRQRLEEQADLQEQLKLEEDAHAKVLTHCLELETEAAAAPPLRKQLEVSKREKADMEFQVLELRIELDDAKASAQEASHAARKLAQGSERFRSEVDLAQTVSPGDDFDTPSVSEGLGSGTCELNPELAEELARLRRDNQCLKENLDRVAVERVQALEDEAEDSKQLANRSVSELLSTRKDLERAKGEIKKLRNENNRIVDLLKLESERLRSETEDLAGLLLRELELAQQKLCKLERTHVETLNDLTVVHESSLAEAKLLLEATKLECNDRLGKLKLHHKSECERLEREHNQAMEILDNRNTSNVEHINIQHKQAREEASVRYAHELQRVSEAHSTQMETFESMRISDLEVLNREHRQKMEMMKNAINIEQGKVEGLQSTIHELEQAQLKISREKRLLWEEAEEYRCLIEGGGGGKGGVSAAAHESLRCEFNDLLKENKSLRDQCRKDVRSICSSALGGGTYNTATNNYHDVIEEYESRMQQLIQDRRDAIMKYNVVSSDAAQAELRLRQLIVENQKNKNRATAAELRYERLARQFQQQPALEDLGPHYSSSSSPLLHDKENVRQLSSIPRPTRQESLDKDIFVDGAASSATECKQS